jgi:hypothetical protein
MSPIKQAIRVARTLLAEGKTGTDLANGLAPVVSLLTTDQKKRLASIISREYYVLGHAAHDPNLYRTCQAAKEAKQEAPNREFKILTYRTPMCASCGLNSGGHCKLMGGRLIDGPNDVPEQAVHRTADLIASAGFLEESRVRDIAFQRRNATSRIASLHQERVAARDAIDHSHDLHAESSSRIAASLLERDDEWGIDPHDFSGTSFKKNSEVVGAGPVEGEGDDVEVSRAAGKLAGIIGGEWALDLPDDLPRSRRASAENTMAESPALDVPEFDSGDHEANSERSLQAQKYLQRLSRHASKLLATGKMNLRLASKIYNHMNDLIGIGAIPNKRIAAIHRQLDAMGGGMEL